MKQMNQDSVDYIHERKQSNGTSTHPILSNIQPAIEEEYTMGIIVDEDNKQVVENQDMNEDEPAIGIALDTRNYLTLVQQTHNSNQFSEDAVEGIAIHTGNYEALIQPKIKSDEEAEIGRVVDTKKYLDLMKQTGRLPTQFNNALVQSNPDEAVIGVPMKTRNYEVLLQDTDKKESIISPGHEETSNEDTTDEDTIDSVVKGQMKYQMVLNGNYIARQRRATHGGDTNQSKATVASGVHSEGYNNTQRLSCFDKVAASYGIPEPCIGWLKFQTKTLKRWRKHFTVLCGLELRYSKDVGRAPVGYGIIKELKQWNEKEFGLEFVYTSGTSDYAVANDSGQFEHWISYVAKAIDRKREGNSRSSSTYTMRHGQHEGYVDLRQSTTSPWRSVFVSIRNSDGYLAVQPREHGEILTGISGYVRSVTFVDEKQDELAIQLVSGSALFLRNTSYDNVMLWHGAIWTAAASNDTLGEAASSVKSSYVDSAISNHAGWLFKQTGVFKSWKRMHFTLHGNEMAVSYDTNSKVISFDHVASAYDWNEKVHGFTIKMRSGNEWKVYADSYETRKHWKALIESAIRESKRVTMHHYFASRARKQLPSVFGGWLTRMDKNYIETREFYIVEGNRIGRSYDVYTALKPLGQITSVEGSTALQYAMEIILSDKSTLVVGADSKECATWWYKCIQKGLESTVN